jgi:hypothetical protein
MFASFLGPTLSRLPQRVQPGLPIHVIRKNGLALVAACHHVVNRSRIFNPNRSRHRQPFLARKNRLSILFML